MDSILALKVITNSYVAINEPILSSAAKHILEMITHVEKDIKDRERDVQETAMIMIHTWAREGLVIEGTQNGEPFKIQVENLLK